MSDFFKIYVDRLRKGESEEIFDDLDPTFLTVDEKELRFTTQVHVEGKAYVAEDHLVICLKADTKAHMPCAICNDMILVPVVIEKFYHTVPLHSLKEPIYDFSGELREQVLLELPHYVECSGGCPERKNVEKFMKKDKSTGEQETYYPFSDLDK